MRYRITAVGPGVTPDVIWEGAGLPDFDPSNAADIAHERAMNALKDWRNVVCARTQNLVPVAVVSNATLKSIVRQRPANLEELSVGGMVVGRFGRLPKRGESIVIDGYSFQVLRADSRKVHSLLVEKPKAAQETPATREGQ